MQTENKIILSGYHGDLYEKMSDLTSPLMENYAKKHNSEYKLIKFEKGNRPISWEKIPLIKNYLKKYDVVLWMDADIVIINDSVDIFNLIEDEKIQYMVQHYVVDLVVPNAGMWMLKKEMLEYLDTIWNNDKYLNHGWWEQAALIELMGFAVTPHRADLKNPTQLYYKTKFLEQKWNHHPNDLQRVADPFFIHVTMYPDRLQTIQQIIDNFI